MRIIRNRYDSLPRWALDGGNGSVASVSAMTEFTVNQKLGILAYLKGYLGDNEDFIEALSRAEAYVLTK